MQEQQKQEDTVYLVAIDTRGLPATDLQEGFLELECPREYFVENIVKHPKTRCMICPLAEICGLDKHLRLYFHEFCPGHGTLGQQKFPDNKELQDAWSEFFPLGTNNAGATLLTIDPGTGYARYSVQGIAYALYDDGSYPLSKEQVWGLTEMASEAKDIYFCDEFHGAKGRFELGRWCQQYKHRSWGPSSIYDPRKKGHAPVAATCKRPHATSGPGYPGLKQTLLF